MSIDAGLGFRMYLLLTSALIACGTREDSHCASHTRLEVSVSLDSSSILNHHGRKEKEEEALSQRYKRAAKFKDRTNFIPKGSNSANEPCSQPYSLVHDRYRRTACMH